MLHHGDSLEILKTLEANSVDAVVTDPPYGLAFMGKKWDYDVPSVELWREVLRVLKPGGHLLSFGGGAISSQAQFSGDSGGASRFFYVAKASKRERNAGLEGMPERIKGVRDGEAVDNTLKGPTNALRPDVATKSQNHHPTVKPIKLMQYLCKLITPPGGAVLDPFMGSGTTGCAAVSLGFDFIGIEREAEYLEIARKRIEHACT